MVNVIGVPPSITERQFLAYLRKYHAPDLPDASYVRHFGLAAFLKVDPAFFAAVWKQEAFVDNKIGGGGLQTVSHNPINMRAATTEWRPYVIYKGNQWLAYANWDIGITAGITHLANLHEGGWNVQTRQWGTPRLSVEDVLAVHAPAYENDLQTYIKNVHTRMEEMKRL